MTTHTIKEGDRVRLIKDHKATGTVDEIWEGEASVVWDISGCASTKIVDVLELIPND